MAPALSTQLQLSTTVEFETVSNNASSIYLMATITAPEVEDKRTPVDVTCVIDRSGSMSGEKIALMKETLSFMVEQLHDNDKLSLVVFDDQVDTLLPLTNMTAQSKVQATKLIESIQVDGSTNLSGALFEALDICKGRKVANDVGSIILFTDGRANKGILKTEDILTGLNGYLKLMKKPINVFTLGVIKNGLD
ncbi:E3 ubiquitin-protein ligase [Acrasis kona]|uniref:E3 ubiquitin-protein ligase n=1 Tax=Acrasis kona TaxID=1008807 RepID=A0AAW2ZQC9_9EUKA